MIKIKIPVIVEGKYDKIKLSSVVDAAVITTNGFGIFKNEEKRSLIRALGKNGLIILSDSDGGGKIIRSHLRGMLGGITVYDLYIPQVEGKEKRKKSPSAAGLIGVEGTSADVLRGIFESFARVHPELCESEDSGSGGCGSEKEKITAVLLYELGLTGADGSAEKRDSAAVSLGLPRGMTSKAFAEAAGMLTTAENLRKMCE